MWSHGKHPTASGSAPSGRVPTRVRRPSRELQPGEARPRRRRTNPTRSVLTIAVLLTLGFTVVLVHVANMQRDLSERATLDSAELYTRALAEFRALYTSEVVERLRETGIEVTHDFRERPGAIPLPATLSMELGKRIGGQDSRATASLYSAYPFPWRRAEGGLRDAFRREAWEWLSANPDGEFHRFEVQDGREVLRYATADRMRPACVDCHNSHAESPKTDWGVGDVRGVLEISYPLRSLEAAGLMSNTRTLAVLVLVAALWFGAVAVFFSRMRRNAADLELEVEQRTHALTVVNANLEQEVLEHGRAQRALQRSELEYRLVADNIPVGIASIGADRSYRLVNAEYARLLGWSADEIPGRHVREILGEIGYEKVAVRIEAVLRGETVQFELDVPLQGGTRRCFSVTYVPRRDAGEGAEPGPTDQVTGYFALVADQTTRRRSEEEGAELRERLYKRQKLEAIGTLAGGIAHDFNNLLAVVLSNAELAYEQLPAASPVRGLQEQITLSAGRAAELVKQILTFSRQDAEESELLDVALVVTETLELLRSTIPTTIEFDVHIDGFCGLVRGDPVRLQQVVMNICTNACHAMPTGGQLTVELAREEGPPGFEGARVRLEVRDTGCGMDPETLDRIFDPFFTTKEVGQGTGLGLATVHGVVEGMHGSIHVESRVEHGTRFRILLPLAEELALPVDQTVYGPLSSTESARILLVDDEPTVLATVERLLAYLGHRVSAHESGESALAAFSADPWSFDLTITDLTMPGMTGLELTRRLRELRPDLAVILLSGDLSRMEGPVDAGVQRLQKPVRLQQLRRCLRAGLASRG